MGPEKKNKEESGTKRSETTPKQSGKVIKLSNCNKTPFVDE